MKSFLAYSLKTFALLLIINVQLCSQNIGVGTTTPTARIHIKSTIQSVTSLDLDYESGTIDPINTSGDYEWFITEDDGNNSAQSAKAPILPNASEVATLMYILKLKLNKEVTISFDYKNIDPENTVDFAINSDHFSFVPPVTTGWKSYSTTFISQAKSDVIKFEVKSIIAEANLDIQIDNLLVTYLDGHAIRIEDGNQTDGYFLRSDDLGYAEWYDLAPEINQAINDNYQNLSFDPVLNEISISDGNAVGISGLKNNQGGTLQLAGNEIIASPNMSLSLPSNDPDSPTFHFDTENKTMDWGISSEPIKGEHSTRWGVGNEASGELSSSWGSDNISSGFRSTTWGRSNEASHENSTSFGYSNISSDGNSTSWGHNNHASEILSTSWGNENLASGWRSTTWGKSNEASQYDATSFGKDNLSSGVLSTSWGEFNIASGNLSLAYGYNNTASGVYSTAWGHTNSASGDISTAWGAGNEITSNAGTAWGFSNNVDAPRATAWGLNNQIADGAFGSTACGASNLSEGAISFVSGSNNEVHSYCEVAFGRFNNSPAGDIDSWVPEQMLFSIGNGPNSNNRTNALTVLKNGNVGIGVDYPIYDLQLLSNSAAKPGNGEWTIFSDRRLKKDISAFTDGLDIISAIEPVWYTYNGLAGIPEGTYVGTIAQDLEEIAPYMVSEFTHRDDEGNSENYKAVNYSTMNFVLINAIKEQQAIIQSQQEMIVSQQAQIDEIMRIMNN